MQINLLVPKESMSICKENSFISFRGFSGTTIASGRRIKQSRILSFGNNNDNNNNGVRIIPDQSYRYSRLWSKEKVYEVLMKQVAAVEEHNKRDVKIEKKKKNNNKPINIIVEGGNINYDNNINGDMLKLAYDRCGHICAEYAKTFYLGTKLMTPELQKAIWAIAAWCRRTDELVDGPNASLITPNALEIWEERLCDIFEGRPYDIYDVALSDTVSNYPLHIQPFKDMIKGMKMDLWKSRYENFDELYMYCYYVAGTVGLMCVPVMGISPKSKASILSVYNSALAFGFANQLTNILRDVGEDARRGRVYLPQDELAEAGLSDEDIFRGKATDKWRNLMKGQIKRARMYYDEAEKGVAKLNSSSRWPVWASLMLYRKILDAIEANDYDNFTKKASVGKAQKLLSLPGAYGRALIGHSVYGLFF